MERETCDQLNSVFNSLTMFKELFSISNYFVQPHVMHIGVQSASEINAWHSHRTFEYSLLTRGEMLYQVEDTEIVLGPGDAVIIPSDMQHRWRVTKEDSTVFGFMLYISCHGEGARQQLNQLRQSITRHKYHIGGFKELADVVERIIASAMKKSGYLEEKIRCLSREAYVEMFSALMPSPTISRVQTQPARQLRGSDPRNLVESVIFFVNDNSHRMLQPAEVGRRMGLSINHLNSILKKYDGRSLGQIIWDRKVFLACNLLDNSNRQIKDIAASLGIEDVDYFCRRFKKSQGLSPSDYRLKNRI